MDLGRIYIIKNEVNNKVYIGKTIYSFFINRKKD